MTSEKEVTAPVKLFAEPLATVVEEGIYQKCLFTNMVILHIILLSQWDKKYFSEDGSETDIVSWAKISLWDYSLPFTIVLH